MSRGSRLSLFYLEVCFFGTYSEMATKQSPPATKYIAYGLVLKDGQKQTLAKAARNGVGVTIRLAVDQLQGEDQLGLTDRQIAHTKKKIEQGVLRS